jgi:hypothetical protein
MELPVTVPRMASERERALVGRARTDRVAFGELPITEGTTDAA